MDTHTIELLDALKDKVYAQDYSKKKTIDGVKIVEIKNFISEEGDFSEILRLNASGETEELPGFVLQQINRTKLFPNSVKAWHLHMSQDEVWYIPPSFHLFVGLWDVRKKSESSNVTMRIVLGEGKSQLLYIPRGVAHGCANFSPVSVELMYFMNQKFNIQNPDEKRIHWDTLGTDFWTPQRD